MRAVTLLTVVLACGCTGTMSSNRVGSNNDGALRPDGSIGDPRDGSSEDAFYLDAPAGDGPRLDDAGDVDASGEEVPLIAPPERRPFVFQQDEVAPPGRFVSLCGRLISNAPTIRMYRVGGDEPVLDERRATTVATVSASPMCAQFRVPSGEAPGLFAVWVRNGEDLSSVYYLNRARPYYVEYDAAPAGMHMRVFGLNMRIAGATPTVKLVAGDTTLEAEVNLAASNENVLAFTMPNGVQNGTAYTVRVSNGHGGTFGEVDADIPLRGRAVGSGDPYGFNVPWAGDFDYTERSTLSSGNNVQAAIDAASDAGGGVVRLAAGTYNGFDLRSGVLVKGPNPGAGVATINGRIGWSGASRAGIVDVTVHSTSSWGGTDAGQEKLVIHRVQSTHDHSDGAFSPRGVRHFLISDWTQSATASVARPIDFGPRDGVQVRYVHMRGYKPTFIHFRLQVVNARFVTVDDSVSTRDYALGYLADHAHDSGHWNLEHTHEAVFLNSTIRAIGDVHIENDGEGWTTQGSSQHATYPPYFGNATGGSSNTIVHGGEDFPRVNADNVEYWVFLMDGTGVGQARRVSNVSGSTLTVTPAWDVPPGAGTRYIVQPLDAYRLIVRGCTLQDNSRNLWIYTGGYDVAIVANTFRNGEMWLRAFEDESGGSGASNRAEVYPMWKSYVAFNQLATTTGDPISDTGREYHRSSHIMLSFGTSQESGGDYSGVYMLVNSVVENRVDTWPVNRFYDPQLSESINVTINDESESSSTRGRAGIDPNTDPVVGVVIQGNTVDDARNAYITGSGVRHIVIADRRGNATDIDDAASATVGHGATMLSTP